MCEGAPVQVCSELMCVCVDSISYVGVFWLFLVVLSCITAIHR